MVESKDVIIADDSGTLLTHDVYNDVIEFDLSDEDAISDDLVKDERQLDDGGELEMELVIPTT